MIIDPQSANGWVSQPSGRGTLDILQSCIFTTTLCSWSALFLNIPGQYRRSLAFVLYKARWMIFAVGFPEVLTGMAAEQWRSACQSVEDFSQLEQRWESESHLQDQSEYLSRVKHNLARMKSSPWTMRHAFFSDAGGFMLDSPDFRPFPIDAQQLFWMVENHHLEYPDVHETTIWDKNKADGFARALTLVQIVWFVAQSIGRCVQRLGLTTIELSTLAFILCTLSTFFFWRHKPLDVVTPIVLSCSKRMEDIVADAGHGPLTEFSQTPLDFVKPPISRTSLVVPFWIGLRAVFDWRKERVSLPIKAFENSRTTPPRGIKVGDMVFAVVFIFAYSGIHLAGWDFAFPSKTEQILWRIASLTLLGSLVFYLLAVLVGVTFAGFIARTFFDNHTENTLMGLVKLLPRWAAILTHLPVIAAYCLARAYVVVEGFVGLRSLPRLAFASVEWSDVVPHL